MQRGDHIIVRGYPDKRLERIVWDEYDTYVLVCRKEIYEEALIRGDNPTATMGFPKEDVLEVLEATESAAEDTWHES